MTVMTFQLLPRNKAATLQFILQISFSWVWALTLSFYQTVLCFCHLFQTCSFSQQRYWASTNGDHTKWSSNVEHIFFLPELNFWHFKRGPTLLKKAEVLCSWLAWTLCAQCLAKLMSKSQRAQDVFIVNCQYKLRSRHAVTLPPP